MLVKNINRNTMRAVYLMLPLIPCIQSREEFNEKVQQKKLDSDQADTCIVNCQLNLINTNDVSSLEQLDKNCKDLCIKGIKPKSVSFGYRTWPKDKDHRLDPWKISALRHFLQHRGDHRFLGLTLLNTQLILLQGKKTLPMKVLSKRY